MHFKSRSCLYVYMSESESAGLSPAPFSHLLPEINFLPSPKETTFILQLEVQPRQFADFEEYANYFSSLSDKRAVVPSVFSIAYSAAPNAPISAEIPGRITFLPVSFSNARNTASFKNVPP